MLTYKATDLFDLKVNGVFPLNCQFVPKKSNHTALDKPGIYMLFFDQEIIYIGIADKELALDRIQKQLSTITLRGKDVSFNDECKTILTSSKLLYSDFSQAISQNKTRLETSKKRIAFAEDNWNLFSKLNQNILIRFVICWFPKNDCFDQPLEEIKSQLIETIKPKCNK